MKLYNAYGPSVLTNRRGRIRGSGLFFDNYGLNAFGFLTCMCVVIGLFVAGVLFIGHEVEKHNCATAAQQYNRDAHFDDWSFICYVQTKDGRKVKLDTYITTHEEGSR